MKSYGEWRYSSTILNLGTRLNQLYRWGNSPRYSLYTRLGEPVDITDKTKISCPCRDSNPDSSVVQPIDHMEPATFPPAVNLSTLVCNYTPTIHCTPLSQLPISYPKGKR
jgi:hypothetical protein